jgi:uncharacterized NAD(P)/FAD-binding protein YdhS
LKQGARYTLNKLAMTLPKTIAIIGGGFSGTMVAVNLARLSDKPLRALIINSGRPVGRGAAYSTQRSEHLLNVAARNMSALADHPSHFVDWLRSRSEFSAITETELREMFVPRRIYGDYICGLAGGYLHPIDPKSQVELQVVDDEAVDVSIKENRLTVSLKAGESVLADVAVLATGNQSPATFPCDSPLSHDRRYRADPWGNWFEHLPSASGRIVLLGTGLTAVDVIVTLTELNWQGKIIAISRNGFLPRSHFRGIVFPDFIPESTSGMTLDALVKLVEEQCRRLERMSQNPAIAIDKLRPHAQRIWQDLSAADKREFVSRYSAKWNSIRHRIAKSIHQRVSDALDAQRLEIVEGAIESLSARDDGLDVHFREPMGKLRLVDADLVINCTGPQTRLSQTDSPLLQNLLNRGLVRPDEVDMGVAVDKDLRVLNVEGQVSNAIYAMGPLLRGTLWETTSVPELRNQSLAIAQSILVQQRPIPHEDVIEYWI